MAYDMGKLGLSTPEIEAEKASIHAVIMERDPEAKANRIAYTYLQTPEEIHRLRILSAMETANTCLCYDRLGGSWPTYSTPFLLPNNCYNSKEPRFNPTDVQRQAHALSIEELDAVFEAQRHRMLSAKVVPAGVTDEDGFSYRKIVW